MSRLPGALTALGLVVLLGGCTSRAGLPKPGADGLYPAGLRPAAPLVSGEVLRDGRQTTMRPGTVTVVNFWGSWCGPCRAEAPGLAAAAGLTAREGVQFVGVDVKDDRDAGRRFEQTFALPYDSIFDQSGVTGTRFRGAAPPQTPTTVLIDKNQRVARVLPGEVRIAELLDLIRRLSDE